ncbi:MAG TPA: tetratricopeptide repeat protein, partial [Pyrinomonadaceae bacterium]|nr:tetratricopeptide repeat protein [Pyrinomonadaceae bacterium]
YMSPEQARGAADIDARTDIFSIGVVLYEMLTGRVPFQGSSVGEVIGAIMYESVKPIARYMSDCPPELERIVTKALQKNPEERYQSVKDLGNDLKSLSRRLEFETELERSLIPNRDESPSVPPDVAPSPAPISTSSGGIKDAVLLTEFTNLTGDPVFDGTLNVALAITLEQSPFVEVFNDARVRHSLKLMGRDPGEQVTRELGRDICMRQSLKAYITGTISCLGSTYVLTLEAVNGRNGDIIGRQLEQTNSKENVLQALGQAAAGLRNKLGESLSSIDMFDAPLQEATTTSMEAFKSYSLFLEYYRNGKTLEAVPFAKRALELDPGFASAYVMLAIMYYNTNQPKAAAEYAAKAFELRDKVSEYERLRITNFYHNIVTGDLEKQFESLNMYKRSYPRDAIPPVVLSDRYESIGQFEKAVEEAREGLRINPTYAIATQNLCTALLRLDRFTEVNELCGEAFEQDMDGDYFHELLFQTAFVAGDEASMASQLVWFHGRDDEHMAINLQANAAAFMGKWRLSYDLSRRSTEMATRSDATESAAEYAADHAVRMAFWSSGTGIPDTGDPKLRLPLFTQIKKALQFARNKVTLSRTALAYSLAGYQKEANELFVELLAERPKDTMLNHLWIPIARAAGLLQSKRFDAAIAELEITERFERAGRFLPRFIRGLAYLNSQRRNDAVREFDKILFHRGEAPLSALYPLARLAKARALKDRNEYEKFFDLWKDADPDMPALQAARKEFEELN